ncbi:unnamed protein product [Discosporangium mesarthrocarpum]
MAAVTASKHVNGAIRYAKNLNPGMSRLANMVLVGGKGSYVWTDDGTRLLDFSTGIGVANIGHCHPRVVKAVQDQAARIMHAQVNIGYHDRMLELVPSLLEIMPSGNSNEESPLDNFFFWNSGSEAVEAAVKIARQVTRKQNVIVFRGGHHGRTIGTMGLTTSKVIYRAGFGPFPSGGVVAPFPYCARCRARPQGGGCCGGPLEDLELLLKQESHPDETAAVLVEPVQGEGGYVVPPPGFMEGLRDFCDRHDILLIADEIQSGVGRTGEWWAVDHWGVVPDLLVFAKGVGSGMPISGVAARSPLVARQAPGSMGGTYAGNAVSCASAIATLEVMHDEDVLQNARARGVQLMEGITRIYGGAGGKVGARFPIKDLRGLGLMVGLEFDVPSGSGVAAALCGACLRRGMILLTCSPHETVRFIPPLTISEGEMEEGLQILEGALEEVFPE